MKPPEDREMEFREHLAELRERLIRITILLFIVFVVVFYKSDDLIKMYWALTLGDKKMVVYSPLEWIVSKILLSFFLAFVVTYPYTMWEIYMFMKPGLYENERKFMKTFLPISYIFFILGLALALFVILPKLYGVTVREYFGVEPYLSVKKTMYNSFKVLIVTGFAMQIPVISAIATRIGLLDSKWLKEKRLIVYIAVFILATNISFDISGITQLIILGMVAVMYEVSILVSKITEKGDKSDEKVGNKSDDKNKKKYS